MGANAITSLVKIINGDTPSGDQFTFGLGGIPVFATTVTRDAAFGGANEKVLAQGQLCFIEATNLTQYYDGAAWQTLGAGGVTRIGGGAMSGASSLTIADIFSATYRNYLVTINGIAGITAESLDIRLVVSGTPAATNYVGQYFLHTLGGASYSSGAAATTSFNNVGDALSDVDMIIKSPFIAAATRIRSEWGSDSYVRTLRASHTLATSYTGLQFIWAGTASGGLINVYGLALS